VKVAIDSSVLVGLINPRDHRRAEALALRNALQAAQAEAVYFDCVAAEPSAQSWRRRLRLERPLVAAKAG
jgi:hypothetical protein